MSATRTEVYQTRTGATQVRGGVLWVVGVVVRIDGRLIRHDEDAAQTAELLRNRSDVGIANQNVLVFFFDDFIALRHHNFHYILARGQADQRLTIISLRRTEWMVGDVSRAGELITPVVYRWLHLVPGMETVIAFVSVARSQTELVVRIIRILSRTIHVWVSIGPLAICPVVPAAGLRGIHQG